MTKYSVVALAALLLLSACGIKGDLVRPSDIPSEQEEDVGNE